LCPHAPKALQWETLDGVHVYRFRYAPMGLETLVQGGGIVNNLKHHPWKWLLVPLFIAGLTWAMAQLIRRLQPACIHAHWIIPQGLALLIASSVVNKLPPFLLTSHGGDLFGLRGGLLSRLKEQVIKRAAAVSVVSRPMASPAIQLGADPQRLVVIPMGVDFEGLFTPGDAADRVAGEILFVGRLVEKKGLKYLLQAFPKVLARVPHARVTIAGYGPEETQLQNLATKLGIADKVHFQGAMQQRELPTLYHRASVFVAPFVQGSTGDKEGLPVALMEAIACACPVVVGELDVLDDIFGPEDADMRVAPQDLDSLANRVIAVLENAHSECDRANRLRERLSRRLAWDHIAKQYGETLQSICGQ